MNCDWCELTAPHDIHRAHGLRLHPGLWSPSPGARDCGQTDCGQRPDNTHCALRLTRATHPPSQVSLWYTNLTSPRAVNWEFGTRCDAIGGLGCAGKVMNCVVLINLIAKVVRSRNKPEQTQHTHTVCRKPNNCKTCDDEPFAVRRMSVGWPPQVLPREYPKLHAKLRTSPLTACNGGPDRIGASKRKQQKTSPFGIPGSIKTFYSGNRTHQCVIAAVSGRELQVAPLKVPIASRSVTVTSSRWTLPWKTFARKPTFPRSRPARARSSRPSSCSTLASCRSMGALRPTPAHRPCVRRVAAAWRPRPYHRTQRTQRTSRTSSGTPVRRAGRRRTRSPANGPCPICRRRRPSSS